MRPRLSVEEQLQRQVRAALLSGTNVEFERCLSPQVKLTEFIGQGKLIADLRNRVEFAKSNKKSLPHIMLSGSPEMGKVTLIKAIAAELGVVAVRFSPEKMRSDRDMHAILATLSTGDILVIDDVSGLTKTVSDVIYQAIASSRLDVTIVEGRFVPMSINRTTGAIIHDGCEEAPGKRTVQLELPAFTVVITTSKAWQIADKLRRWFVVYDFVPYASEDIRDILIRLSQSHGFYITSEAGDLLAGVCNGSPGNAAVLAIRISHYLQGQSAGSKINAQHVPRILEQLGYGENYLRSLSVADKFARMSGLDFENWVAEYFRKEGYRVEMTKATGDHGIDLLLYKNVVLSGAVQCKRWDSSVGEPVVRDFYGALVSANAPEGFIFATTSFTQQAIDFVQGKPIRLVDLESLMKIAA